MPKRFDSPEGATPISDESGLKIHWVKNQNDLNDVEGENIFDAYSKYFHKKPKQVEKWFNTNVLKKVHKAMFGKVWNWAGTYRKNQTSIGVAPYKIQVDLEVLCQEFLQLPQQASPLRMAREPLHHRRLGRV